MSSALSHRRLQPRSPPSPSLPAAILVALVLAAAMDLSVSTLLGYSLRTDRLLLLAVEGSVLAVVAPVLVLCHLSHRLPGWPSLAERAPRSCVLAAAWAPVALAHRSLLPYWLQAAVLLFLSLLGWIEGRRRRRGPSAAVTAAVALAGLGGIALAIAWPLPGRFQLTAPRTMAAGGVSAQAPNLLVIVLDTLRSDHLGAYGYPRPTSPWLDRYARSSFLYDRAVSPSSYTLPPHATLFTGLYPRAHGAQVADGSEAGLSLKQLGLHADWAQVQPLAPEATTLAEIARAAGLETGAICANSAYLSRHFGLDQGFDTYVDRPGIRPAARPAGLSLAARLRRVEGAPLGRALASNERYYLLAPEVNALARSWLAERRKRRFFLFLNYMDPHAPYLPVGRYRKLFRDEGGMGDDDDPVSAYDAEIRYLDDHLGRLFRQLAEWQLLDRTLVVIVADHGESFGEHQRVGHAVSVYEGEVRVPLILHLPGQERGERVDRFVHLVDVLPTLLETMGLPAPADLPGRSLLRDGTRDGGASPIVAHLGRYERDYAEYAIYRDPWKLITRSDATQELYDLRRDPGERSDLLDLHRPVADRLTVELAQFLASTRPRFETRAQEIDAETLERLRALGYVR